MRQEVSPRTRLVVQPDGGAADVLVGALSVGVVGAVGAGRMVVRAGRPAARLVLQPPLLPASIHPARLLGSLGRRGRADRALIIVAVDDAITVVAPRLVDRILRAVPLTDLIRENVDLDALVAEVDLAEIIRQSTGSMSSEAVQGMRQQGIEADQAVDRALGRLHLRRRTRPSSTPDGETPA